MKKIAIGLVALGVLAGPALAQKSGGGQQQQPTPEEIQSKRDAADLDKQYKATLKRSNSGTTAPARVDPWANMRGANEPKR
jgi:hypothetical protein